MSDIGPDQIPVPGGGSGVNQPAKPYGSVADLDRLKQQFPQGAQGAGPLPQAPPGPLGPVGSPPAGGTFDPGGDGGTGPLPGLPAGILDPTTMPDVPVDTPLAEPLGPPGAPPGGGAPLTPAQNRLRIIEALRQSDDPDTREFAEMMIRMLTQG